mgnify:CR=1 FL=1
MKKLSLFLIFVLIISIFSGCSAKNDDPAEKILYRWRGHANLLFSNWLNYFVYQTTPYDIMTIGSEE